MWFTDHQQDTKCLGEEDREGEEKKQRMSKVAVLNYPAALPCSTCASRHKKGASGTTDVIYWQAQTHL